MPEPLDLAPIRRRYDAYVATPDYSPEERLAADESLGDMDALLAEVERLRKLAEELLHRAFVAEMANFPPDESDDARVDAALKVVKAAEGWRDGHADDDDWSVLVDRLEVAVDEWRDANGQRNP